MVFSASVLSAFRRSSPVAAACSTFVMLASSRDVFALSYAAPKALTRGYRCPVWCPFIHDDASSINPSLFVGSVRRFSPTSLCLSSYPPHSSPKFRRYDEIQVEIVSFGRLGASVDVIGLGHREEDCIGEDDPALGIGLILQREISYFRAGRGGLDVIVGEVLPAFVENVREDGRLDISLRDPGGKGKADTIGQVILDKLKGTQDGTLDVGDKSSPEAINAEFPGTSKSAFKKAVAALFKKKLVRPGPYSISLMPAEDRSK